MMLNPNLQSFWWENGKWTKARYKILYGGRSSSKSHDAAGILVNVSAKHKLKVLCTRMFQNRIADSVYSLLLDKAEQQGIRDQFKDTINSITTTIGSEFLFYGLARNIKEIKSLEGVDILFIEEGESLTKEMWDILEPTIRKNNSEIWIVFNPNLITDFVYQRFVVNPPKNAKVRMINYDENVFLSDTMRSVIENAKEEMDEDEFNHIYLGKPRADDDLAVIKRKWLYACVDAHEKLGLDLTGGKAIGFDVADDGGDLNVLTMRNGSILTYIDGWKASEDQLFESSQRAYTLALKHNAIVNYDANGVGAGVGSNVNKLNRDSSNKVKHIGFDSAASPKNAEQLYIVDGETTQQKNKDYFENRKAQAWWSFADKAKATYRAVALGEKIDADNIISLSSDLNDLEKLIQELSTPRKAQSGRLKNMVEKKQDLKKRGISSPNYADSCVMCFFDNTEEKPEVYATANTHSFF